MSATDPQLGLNDELEHENHGGGPHTAIGKRKRKAPPRSEGEWEQVKDRVKELYLERNMKFVEVMQKLEEETGFTAS